MSLRPFLLICLLLCLGLSACSQRWYADYSLTRRQMAASAPAEESEELRDTIAKAGDKLADRLEDFPFPKQGRVISTTFTNMENWDRTSALGRLLQNQMTSRLAKAGFYPVDLREGESLVRIVPGKGEFPVHPAETIVKSDYGTATLVGSYALAGSVVLVHGRVVRNLDQTVMAGVDFELPASAMVYRLLAEDIGPAGRPSGMEPTVITWVDPRLAPTSLALKTAAPLSPSQQPALTKSSKTASVAKAPGKKTVRKPKPKKRSDCP